jgi:PAS domain S-box-containing protein
MTRTIAGHPESGDEQQYRLLVEFSPYCIHQIDLQGRLISMNNAGLRMMGATCEADIIGMLYLDAVSDADRPRIEKLLSKALEGINSHFEFEAANGAIFSSFFIALTDEAGRVDRLMGLTQDVTETRRMIRELKTSEQRLELALKGARQGLWDLDLSDGSLVLSEDWAHILGYQTGDLLPSVDTLWELCHPDDQASVRQRLGDHLRGDSLGFESSHRMRTKDNEWRWVMDRAAVVERDESGRGRRLIGTTMDITRDRELQEQQRALEAQLQQARKMETLGQLAGGIAHDFNNLLTVISGNVDLGFADIAKGGAPLRRLKEIQNATSDASALISELLAFSKVRAVQLTSLDLNALIDKMMSMIQRLLPASIELEFDPKCQNAYIQMDASQIRQVILNLCVNARDAIADEGRIEIGTRKNSVDGADAVELYIRDTGCGMDERTKDRMFDPFFTTKHTQGGNGLGLAMVAASVEQHKAKVDIESEPGRGTRISITFAASEHVQSEIREGGGAPASGTGTVLIVEDDDMVREVAREMLTRAGYAVLCAVDGIDGAETFSAHRSRIDLVFLDVIMPRANGVETYKAIRQIDPAMPVVFTTGYNKDNTLPAELLNKDDLYVLPKPYDQLALLSTIEQALQRP